MALSSWVGRTETPTELSAYVEATRPLRAQAGLTGPGRVGPPSTSADSQSLARPPLKHGNEMTIDFGCASDVSMMGPDRPPNCNSIEPHPTGSQIDLLSGKMGMTTRGETSGI